MVRIAAVEPDPNGGPVGAGIRAGQLAAGEHAGQPDPACQREEDDGEQPAPVVEPGDLVSEGPSEDGAPPARGAVHQPGNEVGRTPGCHSGEYRIAPELRRYTPRTDARRHLLLIGGAEDKLRDRVILSRFIALAGGRAARIAVVATASSYSVEVGERYRAAQVVGLDVAGIDFICPDITEPVRETGGGIVEVNAAPGFRMHTHPTDGEPQYVAKPVLDLLFPAGAGARIPIVAVTGTNGKTTTVRMIAHIFKLMGRRVGMTSTDGIVIDGRLTKRGDMSGPRSAQMVLQNPTVDMAVFEVARGGILREGLGYDRNDVAVVTNVTGDHLGLGGIDTQHQLAAVKSVVVDAVPKSGTAVLNADDPLVARMAGRCGGRIVYFSTATQKGTDEWDRLDSHCGRGGAAFALQATPLGELIMLRLGPRTMPVLYTHLIPATFGGKARMNVANALAAAWSAGAHLHDIRQGLRTFTTSFFQAPGRLNLIELGGIRVVIDYCHNVDGMRNLADFVTRMVEPEAAPAGGASQAPRRGRAIGVIGIPGDRRDDDQRAYGALAATAFDEIYVREDRHLRGREPGVSADNVLAGIRTARASGDARVVRANKILEELPAVRAALRRASPGDLVACCVDDAVAVYREANALLGAPGAAAFTDPGELDAPEG
jgi:cyanophycin synthetase